MRVPTFVALCWNRQATVDSKSAPGWIRVGGSGAAPTTAGNVKDRVKCGVKPYATSSRIDACVSKLVFRPNIPWSKLHSPFEFVGVARPKTGPWAAATAADASPLITSRTTANFISFLREGPETRAQAVCKSQRRGL